MAAIATGYVEVPDASSIKQCPTQLALHGSNQMVIGYEYLSYFTERTVYLACVPNTECKQPIAELVEMDSQVRPAVATIPSTWSLRLISVLIHSALPPHAHVGVFRVGLLNLR